MMTGQVIHLHALLSIPFLLENRPDLAIEFVVDTGFTGFLTLPVAAVEALQLPFLESIPANLATNDEVELPVHVATILWHGEEMEVRVLATGRRPLLGTALLAGYSLTADFVEHGSVRLATSQPDRM